MGEVATSDYVSHCWGPLRLQGYVAIPPSFGPLGSQGEERVGEPLLILFPFVGDPRECRDYVPILPCFGPPRRHG